MLNRILRTKIFLALLLITTSYRTANFLPKSISSISCRLRLSKAKASLIGFLRATHDWAFIFECCRCTCSIASSNRAILIAFIKILKHVRFLIRVCICGRVVANVLLDVLNLLDQVKLVFLSQLVQIKLLTNLLVISFFLDDPATIFCLFFLFWTFLGIAVLLTAFITCFYLFFIFLLFLGQFCRRSVHCLIWLVFAILPDILNEISNA